MRNVLLLLAGLVGIACGPSGATDGPRRAPGEDPSDPPNDAMQASTAPVPCDVERVLSKHCYECHDAEPRFGAPMALRTQGDFAMPSHLVNGDSIASQVAARIYDTARPMPPPPRAMSDEEKAILDDWLRSGTPARQADFCEAPHDQGLAGGDWIPVALPPDADVDSEGAPNFVVEPPAEGECDRVQFRAHGQKIPGDATPFPVGAPVVDLYECFYFKAPWDAPTQGLSFEAIIDNEEVLHHWLLYSTPVPYPDGGSDPCLGIHPDGTLLAGWAPGAPPWYLPKDVGMEMPWGPDGYLMLELHYNNFGLPTMDASGVEVCATQDLRPNTASVSWLGTELVAVPPGGGTAVGECNPPIQEPVTVLRSWPHMHLLGRRLHTEIVRGEGGIEPLIDIPFDFNFQYAYDTPAIIRPGDKLVTTCHYANDGLFPVVFGPGTTAEMCYNFVVHYPAGALLSAGGIHKDSCM